jgi:mono/diheme cytochrome c family protein
MSVLHSQTARPSRGCRTASRATSGLRRYIRAGAFALITVGVLAGLATGCGSAPQQTATTSGGASAKGSPVARGRNLYTADGCAGCHSLDGPRLEGPTWKGLAGSRVRLSDGRTVAADNAYLARHIVEPNALTVQGYPGEVMAESIQSLDLQHKPADVAALVAFIDAAR